MKNIFYAAVLSFFLILSYSGCDATIYEIVEVEEDETPLDKMEIITEKKEEKTETEIIPDKTSTVTETTIKTEIPVEFTIQIGAFQYENNASRFMGKAQYKLNDVNIKVINSLYKIRTGKYNNRLDAMKMLDEIKAMGYQDAFIIQSNF